MWITSFPEAMGWGFWVIFEKKTPVSWDLNLDEASWFLDLGEASPVMDYGMPARCWVRWNSQHSRNCVSLSLCWKSKSQEGNKSFVPGLPRVVNVSSVFWDSYAYEQFHVFVYLDMLHLYASDCIFSLPVLVSNSFLLMANSLMSSMYIRWLIFSYDLLSLYPPVHFLRMWLIDIIAITNSNDNSASPWNIPLRNFYLS